MSVFIAFRLLLRTRLLHDGGLDEILVLVGGVVLAIAVVKLTHRSKSSEDDELEDDSLQ